MKTFARIAGAAAITLTAVWSQFAAAESYSYGSSPRGLSQQQVFDSPEQQARMQRRHDALLALRAEGLKLRDADGGKLTPEHEAYLQAKLDAINADK